MRQLLFPPAISCVVYMLLNDEIKCFQEMETRRKTRTVAIMFSSYRRYSHPLKSF
jgi:hypothetical protein